jgi:hypothetical protein
LAHPVHLYWPACLPAQAVAAANTTPNLKPQKSKTKSKSFGCVSAFLHANEDEI